MHVNLGNLRSPLLKGELNVDATVSLINFVDIWLTTFKKNTVKLASYNRLETSRRALEGYDISKGSRCHPDSNLRMKVLQTVLKRGDLEFKTRYLQFL